MKISQKAHEQKMLKLNIEHRGAGKKRLVFFHGWGFDHQVLLPLAEDLGAEYACYLVDLPGFGTSAPMDWLQFKSQLLAEVPVPFAIVGWSMGGLWATRLALETEGVVQRLTNIASSPRFLAEKEWPGIEAAALRAFSLRLKKDREEMILRFSGMQGRVAASKRMDVEGRTVPLKRAKTAASLPRSVPPLSQLQAGLSVLAEWDLRSALEQLAIPTAYFFGRADPIVPIEVMQRMQQRYPQFDYLIFEDSAHMPFVSEYVKFLHTLRQWLLDYN